MGMIPKKDEEIKKEVVVPVSADEMVKAAEEGVGEEDRGAPEE